MANWTPEEETLLQQLRDNGTPPTEIAERLGRSTSAVCQHAIRTIGLPALRAPKKFWIDSDTRRLHELFSNNTIATIALELDRTEQSVRDKAKNENLYRRDYPL